jgi:hypothetical protein
MEGFFPISTFLLPTPRFAQVGGNLIYHKGIFYLMLKIFCGIKQLLQE